MRVVVTGGAGFIGSHLADSLVDSGHEVHVVDNLASGNRRNVSDSCIFHELDVTNAKDLQDLVKADGPFDRWYHLAAQADVRVSVAEPLFDASVNVLGTIAVLEAARMSDAIVIFASTGGAIYGEVVPPTPESAPAQPEAQYGAAKLAAEGFCAQYSRLYSYSHVVMRYANVYGPRQDPHGEAGVVAIFGGKVLEDQPARIFGDGTQTRDYVYVGDVVDATLRAADAAAAGRDTALRTNGAIPIYNVGTGTETSVLELWQTMQSVCNVDLGANHEPARPGELARSALDASLVKRELGAPLDTPLADGLRRTVDWLRARVHV